MSIPTGGLAALLVVATLALSSCGSDDASVTTTTTVSPGSAQATATQTVAAETTPAKTTTTQTQTSAPKPAPTTTQTTAPAPKPATSAKPQSACPPVDLGARDGDVEETYARITSISKTSCELTTYVVQQWGGQKIGADKALLPIGWSCSGNTCRKGGSSISFVIDPPSNSD